MSYEQIKMSRRKLLIEINSGNNKITFSFAYLLIQNLYSGVHSTYMNGCSHIPFLSLLNRSLQTMFSVCHYQT